MTNRARISKKAQKRRRLHWISLMYWGAFWDACRPNYWLSYEIYYTLTYDDATRQLERKPIKPYVPSLLDRVYIPYVHAQLAFERACKQIAHLPFHKAIQRLGTVDLRLLLADKFKEYQEEAV